VRVCDRECVWMNVIVYNSVQVKREQNRNKKFNLNFPKALCFTLVVN